jgi:hypothetical protein
MLIHYGNHSPARLAKPIDPTERLAHIIKESA